VTGLFLVAGTTLEFSRALEPVPQLRASVTLIAGTADRTAPYAGGQLTRRGLSGLAMKRRAARNGEQPGEHIAAGAEDVMADWAAANGTSPGPVVEELPAPTPADLRVTRKTWERPGCRPVTLYRINGGGHGWPGGPPSLPARGLGPIARHLDATGLLLDMASRETASAAGRPALPYQPRAGLKSAPPWPDAAPP
jgi:polyhydroxybutyrate depolymerase